MSKPVGKGLHEELAALGKTQPIAQRLRPLRVFQFDTTNEHILPFAISPIFSKQEQPLQPSNENIYLWNIGIEEAGSDGRSKRPSRLLLPSKPSVDDRLWLV